MTPTIDISNQHCGSCNKKYSSKMTYIRQMVQIHNTTLPKVYSEPSNFGPKSRYCKVCDMKFKLKSALSGYLQKIHHIANVY